MATQTEKALLFRSLHKRETAFIIPNPWDAGSARSLRQYHEPRRYDETHCGDCFSDRSAG